MCPYITTRISYNRIWYCSWPFWLFVSLFNNSKIDLYIYKKYMTTFSFSLLLLLLIVIVIDFSEKIDDFIQNDLSFFTINV